ncbi:MAG TPA: YihY/virulence factor BrkB family protein [Nocardiopsis listeri]|uniref:YihY/virulence factor BrkB family protein n=1 Tax=Nocardiopsis listeri TaxID=53440 RepID=UPI001DA661E4|nr:YihY/virulence factor BrkB family protein [Nocardiopsis listeri]HJE58360.1 YihY/virulence factor BrkB family protein [Nocardiopsis listeri]
MAGERDRGEGPRGTAGAFPRWSALVSRPGLRALAVRIWKELKESQFSLLAAGMAFRALLALFPALLAVISVFGMLADPDDLADQIRTWLVAFPEDVRELIENQLHTIATADGRTLGFAFAGSVLMALWSASGGMYGLMQGCNAAYRVVDGRSYLVKRGIAMLMALGVGAFLCVGVGSMVLLPMLLDHFGLNKVAEILVRVGQWVLLICVTVVGLGIVYRVAPHRESPSEYRITPGVVIAMVLWVAGSWVFTFSVQRFGHFGATYGTIAGVIVLMLWLWLSSLVVLFGAVVNAELEQGGTADPAASPKPRLR